MDKRVLRESDRNLSDHSDEDQTELQSESERNERSGSVPDVKFLASQSDSKSVKNLSGEKPKPKVSRYSNFNITETESDDDASHDSDLETTKSSHSVDKSKGSPLLRAQEIESRAAVAKDPPHSRSTEELASEGEVAKVPPGEDKGPESSPTSEKKGEKKSETEKPDSPHLKRRRKILVAPESTPKSKPSFVDVVKKKSPKRKTAKPIESKVEVSPEIPMPTKKAKTEEWIEYYSTVTDTHRIRLELDKCIADLCDIVTDTGRKKAKKRMIAVTARQTELMIDSALKKAKLTHKVSDTDDNDESDLRSTVNTLRMAQAKSEATCEAQAKQISTLTIAASLPPPTQNRSEREREDKFDSNPKFGALVFKDDSTMQVEEFIKKFEIITQLTPKRKLTHFLLKQCDPEDVQPRLLKAIEFGKGTDQKLSYEGAKNWLLKTYIDKEYPKRLYTKFKAL